MNMKAYSKNRIKRNYQIKLICINSLVISFIIFVTLQAELNVSRIIIFACFALLPLNMLLTFSYFKEVRPLESKRTFEDMNKIDRKKYMMVNVLCIAGFVLGGFLLFLKGMGWIGVGILNINLFAFLYYCNKLLKKPGEDIPRD
ncbi:MAG: hypothetical protein HOI47_18595 [Candidatus Scalindua sp.]|nr:hypothetical protein [Candidatus Scalindua sp.]MBT7212977.1 hypothetical protein [Candidatus Scalindua sp.]MBT7589560.1 hypothetical protein [Candidatus Scalindua sp.]